MMTPLVYLIVAQGEFTEGREVANRLWESREFVLGQVQVCKFWAAKAFLHALDFVVGRVDNFQRRKLRQSAWQDLNDPIMMRGVKS